MKIFTSMLGMLLAAGMLVVGSAGTALADGHGHGDRGRSRQNNSQNASNQYNQYGPNANANDGNGGDDNNGNNGNDDHTNGGPHGCINPAGHQRGWCNRQNNQNQNGQNAQIHGIVTGINNGRITILQGLIPITFDATYAIQNNNTNGAIYPSRSIVAYGYYDNQNLFHANAIR